MCEHVVNPTGVIGVNVDLRELPKTILTNEISLQSNIEEKTEDSCVMPISKPRRSIVEARKE